MVQGVAVIEVEVVEEMTLIGEAAAEAVVSATEVAAPAVEVVSAAKVEVPEIEVAVEEIDAERLLHSVIEGGDTALMAAAAATRETTRRPRRRSTEVVARSWT